MQRRFRWAVMLLGVFLCAFGVVRSHLFTQRVWEPAGLRRFLMYTILSGAVAGIFFLTRRAWLLPCFFLAAILYAGALAGWRPVGSLAFFLLACYCIGRSLLQALSFAPDPKQRPLLLHGLTLVAGVAVWGFLASLLAY